MATYIANLRLLSRDVRLFLVAAALIGFSWDGVRTVLLNIYLLRLGYGPEDVGVINGIGAFAFAAQTVVVRGYYAMQDTLFPAIFGTIAVLLSIPLYVYGLQVMGVTGVALAISLSSIFQVALLYALWNKRSKNKA